MHDRPLSDDEARDQLTLMTFALGGLSAIVGTAAVLWTKLIDWAVRHHILVPASSNPVFEFPAAAGAGLDLPRVLLLAAVVIALLTLGALAAQRAWRARREIR